MPRRRVVSLILSAPLILLVLLGLIDPLEGGLSLLMALALLVAVRYLSGVALPRFTWLSLAVTLALGLLVLVLVIATGPAPAEQAVGATAPNPVSVGVRLLAWVYRLSVVVTLAGVIAYVVRIARAQRN